MATEFISNSWLMPTNANAEANRVSNYSLDFDGSTQYILIDPIIKNFSTDNFTISAWVNFTTLPSGTTEMKIYNELGSSNRYISLSTRGSQPTILFRYGNQNNNYLYGTTTITTNRWYHVAVTYSTTDGIKLYLDTNLENTASYLALARSAHSYASTGAYFYAGSASNYLDGKIDHLAVFDYALSTDQINYLYNSGTPVNPMAISGNAPIAYYSLGGSSTGDAGTSPSTLTVPNESVPSATVFDFTGNLQYIRASNFGSVFSGKTAFSFSGWFKLSTLLTSQQIFNIHDGSDSYFSINTYSNQLRFNIDYANSTAFAYVNQAQLLTGTDTWFHYAGYFDGSQAASADRVKVYINGTPATLIFSGTPPTSFGTIPATAYTQIGGQISSFNGFQPTGSASNIQLWDTNLSPSEITTLYNNGVPLLTGTQPQASNLKAWWKMNVDTSVWNSVLNQWEIIDYAN